MAKIFSECPDYIKNSSTPYDCLVADLRNNSFCCLRDCCLITRRRRDVWQTWYFWIVILLFILLIFTIFLSYIAGFFKKKHHNLIRIRHQSARQYNSQPAITAIAGSDGIIQPNIQYQTYSKHMKNASISDDGLLKCREPQRKLPVNSQRHLISPLSPPYTPIKPVTIIRGSAPPLGYRQTSTYTELVLPPGYIQSRNSISSKA